MIDLFRGALELQEFCASEGWQNCLIGGIAVMRWSEVRATRDIDLALLTGYRGEEPFIDSLLTRYASRIRDAKGIAIRHGSELDWNYIETQLRPLAEAKDDPKILQTLISLRDQYFSGL